MQLICVQLFINAILISAGAATAYHGADNRLSGYEDERYTRDRDQPEIEYHYPDERITNKISATAQALSPSVHYVTAGATPPRAPTHFVSHVRPVGRRKPVATSTTEVFRTSQWGTAKIPYRGAVVNVRPAHGRQRNYRGVVTTRVLAPNAVHLQNMAPADDIGRSPSHDQPVPERQPCYRCPADKTVIAARAAEFVLLEKPLLKPCHQRSWSPEVKLELLSGASPGSALNEGIHVIHARIVYRQQTLQSCQFRYTVIVHKCLELERQDHLTANCTSGTAWGSECQLTCGAGHQTLGPTMTVCGDNLRWSQPLPRCIAVAGCTLPSSPEHSRLSCTTSDHDITDLMPEGTTCRYVCTEGYEQSSLVDITCNNGEWNSTVEPSCREIINGKGGRGRHQQRHRKHRLGSGRKNDPCRPNPCKVGGQCVAGPHAALALCNCPPDLTKDGQSCHNVVLVERLMSRKDRKRNKQTTIIGHVYARRAPIATAYDNGA